MARLCCYFQDGGQSLLRACMESNWVKAETYIKAGSPLECRSEVRLTIISRVYVYECIME